AFAVAVLLALLGPEHYAAWGWRALFVLGALLSLGMLVYYGRHVVDAPMPPRRDAPRDAPRDPAPGAEAARSAPPLRSRSAGAWAPAVWQVFVLMTGLWLLTDTTVLLLTERLNQGSPLDPTAVPVVMGLASVAQALAMAVAGHLSTLTGRRRLLVIWGAAAAVAGPVLWWCAVHAPALAAAAACAALLPVVTVSAYGPVSAYLSERFPTEIRSTGYGAGHRLALVLPALSPWLGQHGTVLVLVALGGVLVVVGAALGPRLSGRELDADLDTVALGGRR